MEALTLSWPTDLLRAFQEPPLHCPQKSRRGHLEKVEERLRFPVRGGTGQMFTWELLPGARLPWLCEIRTCCKQHAPWGVSSELGSKKAAGHSKPPRPRLRAEPPPGRLLGFVPFLWLTDQTLSPVQAQLRSVAAPICKPDPPVMSVFIPSRCRRKPLLNLPSKNIMGEELWEKIHNSEPVICLSCTEIY